MTVQEDVVGVSVDGFAPDSQNATCVHLPIGDAFRLPGREMDLLRLDARRIQLGLGFAPAANHSANSIASGLSSTAACSDTWYLHGAIWPYRSARTGMARICQAVWVG
ncbi:hypothetical protein GCM10010307_23320 [Streptomyces vastus]|uniref:Uncharacterized protein n=1 Tax=Streptomyces vastus TaxID=285451 RepID=A0ABN3QNJ2_9ACTN